MKRAYTDIEVEEYLIFKKEFKEELEGDSKNILKCA
jgi:hypothetical protein